MPTTTELSAAVNNGFVDITVQPSFAKNAALVRWTVLPCLKEACFYVLRSDTGRPPWKLLTPEGTHAFTWQDPDFDYSEQMLIPHYRIVAVLDDKEVDCPIVAAFDKLTRKQYGAVRQMLNLELRRMRAGNGLEIVHLIPLYDGEPNPKFTRAGQQIGTDAPDDPEPSYGMPFKGGFSPGFWTYMELGQKSVDEVDRPGGVGTSQDIRASARLLAFPQPMTGHLLVHPPTDERWIVTEKVVPYTFRGVAVVAYDVSLNLLNNMDPRYGVPVPPKP